MKLYGIWCKETSPHCWLREKGDKGPILAYDSLRQAQKRAANFYGYPTYTAARKADWCEVRPLVTP